MRSGRSGAEAARSVAGIIAAVRSGRAGPIDHLRQSRHGDRPEGRARRLVGLREHLAESAVGRHRAGSGCGRLVARAVSRTDFFWRWCIRRTSPIMAMVITSDSPLLLKNAAR
jgi:hypothetical protein